jgi:hypothetical protein
LQELPSDDVLRCAGTHKLPNRWFAIRKFFDSTEGAIFPFSLFLPPAEKMKKGRRKKEK